MVLVVVVVVAGRTRGGIEKPMDGCRICEDELRTQRFKFYSGPVHQIKEIKVDRTCTGFLLPLSHYNHCPRSQGNRVNFYCPCLLSFHAVFGPIFCTRILPCPLHSPNSLSLSPDFFLPPPPSPLLFFIRKALTASVFFSDTSHMN